ncbi:MAG: single-stranded DNA-binding protein [Acidimicrobiales bacterium]
MNNINAIGRLVAAPEMHFTTTGKSLTRMRIAIPRPGEDAGAVFIDVVSWDTLADACAEHLVKGRQVAVWGRLEQREWTGDSGTKFSRIEIIANQVDFLAMPKAKDDAEPQASEQAS